MEMQRNLICFWSQKSWKFGNVALSSDLLDKVPTVPLYIKSLPGLVKIYHSSNSSGPRVVIFALSDSSANPGPFTFYVQICTITIPKFSFFLTRCPFRSYFFFHPPHHCLAQRSGQFLVKSIPPPPILNPPQWTSSSLSFNLWLAVQQVPP